jgi:hypothetical protein
VERSRQAILAGYAESLQRDVSRRRREREEADVGLRPALLLILRDQVLDVVTAGRLTGQRLGQPGIALAGLRAVRLVDDDRKVAMTLAGDRLQMLSRELLDGADDDPGAALDRLFELA